MQISARNQSTLSLIQRASSFIETNDYVKAKDLYLKIVKKEKHNSDAWQMLGTLHGWLGDLKAAEACLLKAVRLSSSKPQPYYNLGCLYQQQHKLTEAIKFYRKSLKLNPTSFEAGCNLALALHENGDFDASISEYKRLFESHPNSEKVKIGLASALLACEHYCEAEKLADEIIKINLYSAEGYCIIGTLKIAQKKTEEALYAFNKAIKINNNIAQAYYGLAEIAYLNRDLSEAARFLKQTITCNQYYTPALYKLGHVYQTLGRQDEAIQCYKILINNNPQSYEAYAKLAAVFDMSGQWQNAEDNYKKAIEINPESIDSIVGLAHLYEKQQHYESALTLLEPILNKNTTDTFLVTTYAEIKRSQGYPNEAISILEKTLNGNEKSRKSPSLHLTLGNLYDDVGNYDGAFKCFKIANKLSTQNKWYKYDNVKQHSYVDWCKKSFTKRSIACLPHAKQTEDMPVFIIGMPRSGTSLVEQIISSHPEAFGAGELTYIYDFVDKLPDNFSPLKPGNFADSLDCLTEETVNKYANFYLEKIKQESHGAIRITDKYPGNFLYLWIIELLFPNAHVIHCSRSPLDTCLSIYFNDFSAGQSYTTDLNNIGAYYLEYTRLMEHWKETLTIRMLDVTYEDLVNSHTQTCKRMIDFLGLQWDKRCLDFYKNRRIVNTPSYHQVRKEVYKTSIGRWQNYARHIEPLIDALGIELAS